MNFPPKLAQIDMKILIFGAKTQINVALIARKLIVINYDFLNGFKNCDETKRRFVVSLVNEAQFCEFGCHFGILCAFEYRETILMKNGGKRSHTCSCALAHRGIFAQS